MLMNRRGLMLETFRSGDVEGLRSILLSKRGAHLLTVGNLGFFMLRKSIEGNRSELTELLLDHGCPAGLASFEGNSPLHLAVMKKNNCCGLVARLLERGGIVQHRNRMNKTVLQTAFQFTADDKVMHLLLVAHLKRSLLNEADEFGLSYLHIACATAVDLSCVRKLIERGGADLNAQVDADHESLYAGSTPLHLAVEYGKTEVIEYLLSRGANVGITNAQGSTPIHLALELGQTDTIELLFAHDNTGLNCINNFGLSHFMAACACSSPANVREFIGNMFHENQLLDVHEVVDGGDHTMQYIMDGFTPLHVAAIYGRLHTVKYLLVEGVDCCPLTHGGVTPVMFANKNGFPEVARVISAHCQRRHDEDSE